MNEQKFNNQTLREYLLGSLPEPEAERFDELSFTDDGFNASLDAAEKDLVDAYIHNELTGATLERFKSHYLTSPLRREKVRFANAFQVYAEKNIAETTVVGEAKSKRGFREMLAGIFAAPRSSLQWGFALAALAFLFVGGWLWRENSRLRFEMSQGNVNREQLLQRETELAGREKQLRDDVANQRSADSETEKELAQILEERAQLEERLKKQTQAQQRLVEQQKLNEQQLLAAQRRAANAPPISASRAAIASFILAPSLRGGSRIQTVSILPRAAGISATLELEADEYVAYRAVLRSAAGEKSLWQSGKLKSKSIGGNTRLNVNFPAKLLPAGVYSIELTGIAADGAAEIISDYSFRVVR